MPRFYFHHNGEHVTRDREGREFKSFEHAVVHATHEARDAAAHDLRDGALNLDHSLEIATELGEVLICITFRDVVRITP